MYTMKPTEEQLLSLRQTSLYSVHVLTNPGTACSTNEVYTESVLI